MKKHALIVVFLIAMSAISINLAAAVDSTPNIQLSLLKYSPYPAEPGNYVMLTLKIENLGNADADDVRIKLIPEYPFSVDSESTVTIKNSATPLSADSGMAISIGRLPVYEYTTVEYKIRVAADVLEGNNPITFWYQTQLNDVWRTEIFNVFVQGSDRMEVVNVMPSTLSPGKPTDVVFVLNNSGTAFVRDVSFTWNEKNSKILPLGSGNIRYIGSIDPHKSVEIPFTLVADPSATPGVYTINANISYIIGSNITKSMSTNIGMFIGGDGDFDVSLQDSQSGSVSISIANIGANPATSVAVKIPEQENFVVSGATSSFIGNLNPGDFTLATFQITSRGMQNMTGPDGQPPQNRQFNATGKQLNMTASNMLKVEISYTNTNGVRQTVIKQISFQSQGTITTATRNFSQSQKEATGFNFIIFGITGIVIIIVLFKFRKKITGLLKKKK